uniref:Uncharacterized protein n=1 Tax=viral metagenome TaxID=1070528 RepID=A0A6C0AF27_9ZZZZ
MDGKLCRKRTIKIVGEEILIDIYTIDVDILESVNNGWFFINYNEKKVHKDVFKNLKKRHFDVIFENIDDNIVKINSISWK